MAKLMIVESYQCHIGQGHVVLFVGLSRGGSPLRWTSRSWVGKVGSKSAALMGLQPPPPPPPPLRSSKLDWIRDEQSFIFFTQKINSKKKNFVTGKVRLLAPMPTHLVRICEYIFTTNSNFNINMYVFVEFCIFARSVFSQTSVPFISHRYVPFVDFNEWSWNMHGI